MTSDTTLKKQLLRNNEYYCLQTVFDDLHSKSAKGYRFKNLMQIIEKEDNILLAYRNIKNNKGSTTKGTDGLDITRYEKWEEEKFVKYFQDKLQNYFPKSVRRVEIPKSDGRTRPLGIPCMDDRIIQQCIKQVLEPICEAKFHDHSYGFRPNRDASNAIARVQYLMWQNKLHHVVDIDIKGFFDNVNHAKLLKQLWSIGIQDKNLLCVIGKILKSEIQGVGIPDKGTPQGGIISQLLSNVVLNELDWWLSDQWETYESEHPYSRRYSKYRALRNTNLKEFFIVRYADDFKILCRDYKVAQKIFVAAKEWLKERLGLEISPEKSTITNARKKATEFLGFALRVKLKRKRHITRTNITKKAKKAITDKLKKQVKVIQNSITANEVNKLNAMILGMHNYYKTASLVSLDFADIDFVVRKSLDCRFKGHISETPNKSKTYLKLYGGYNGRVRTVAKATIFPIYGIKYKEPPRYNQAISNYTETGRAIVHDKLSSVNYLVQYLLSNKEFGKSVEYNDNRISLIAGQQGKCFITNQPLLIGEMECHHKKPKELGGTDEYGNLVWVSSDVHKLIHSTQSETINKYLQILNLDQKALKKVNSLRLSVGNLGIVTKV